MGTGDTIIRAITARSPWERGDPGSEWDGHGAGVLPVLPALRELVPALPRGSVLSAEDWGLLCLSLAAEASASGAWCAVAGVPELGVVAAAEAGLDPGRMLLVPEPGPNWPQVVASLLDGCELVILRPPGRLPAQQRERLQAIVRRSGAVLLVAGEWPGAPVRLAVTSREWHGIGDGHGRLSACRARVVAGGRGAAARHRELWLWLPAADGSVTVADGVAAGGDPAIRRAG
jgi:hypothetical protein